jgi:hypothetical protein
MSDAGAVVDVGFGPFSDAVAPESGMMTSISEPYEDEKLDRVSNDEAVIFVF